MDKIYKKSDNGFVVPFSFVLASIFKHEKSPTVHDVWDIMCKLKLKKIYTMSNNKTLKKHFDKVLKTPGITEITVY